MPTFSFFAPQAVDSTAQTAAPSSGDESDIPGSSPTARSHDSSRADGSRSSGALTSSSVARHRHHARKVRGVKRARITHEKENDDAIAPAQSSPEPHDDDRDASDRVVSSDSDTNRVIPAAPVQPAAQAPKRKRGRPPKDTTKDTAKDTAKDAAKQSKSKELESLRRSSRIVDLEAKKTALADEMAKRARKKARSTPTAKKTKPAASNTKRVTKEWEVESIVDSHTDPRTQEKKFEVKWKGYPTSKNTWEPMENLVGCDKAVEEYEAREKAGVKKRGRRTKG